MTHIRPTYLSSYEIFENQNGDIIEDFLHFMQHQVTVTSEDTSIFGIGCKRILDRSLKNKIITDDIQKQFMQYLTYYNFIELAKIPEKTDVCNLIETVDRKPDVKCWLVSDDDYYRMIDTENLGNKKIYSFSEIKETKNIRRMNDGLEAPTSIQKETSLLVMNYLSLIVKSRNINNKKRRLVLIDPYFLTEFNMNIDKPFMDRMNKMGSWDFIDLFIKHCQFACELEILTLGSQVDISKPQKRDQKLDPKINRKIDLRIDEDACELEKTLQYHFAQTGARKGIQSISIAVCPNKNPKTNKKTLHARVIIVDQFHIHLDNFNKSQPRTLFNISPTDESAHDFCNENIALAKASNTYLEFSIYKVR